MTKNTFFKNALALFVLLTAKVAKLLLISQKETPGGVFWANFDSEMFKLSYNP